MGDRLPQLKPQELVRALHLLGFVTRRVSGSHAIMRHPETKQMVVIPLHAKDLKRSLLFGILKQANIRSDELRNIL